MPDAQSGQACTVWLLRVGVVGLGAFPASPLSFACSIRPSPLSYNRVICTWLARSLFSVPCWTPLSMIGVCGNSRTSDMFASQAVTHGSAYRAGRQRPSATGAEEKGRHKLQVLLSCTSTDYA